MFFDPKTNVAIIQEHLRSAMKVMSAFPESYVPNETSFNELSGGLGSDFEDILRDERAQGKLHEIIETWPRGLLPIFVKCSSLLGQGLAMYGRQTREPSGLGETLLAAMHDPKLFNLLLITAQMAKESPPDGEENEPDSADKTKAGFNIQSMPKALFAEIQRRVKFQNTPFSKTISTLLGNNALQWLATAAREGFPKIQPHEFSRSGWQDLGFIQDQIAIEQELLRFGKINEENAKIIVALCWTIAALASYMEPGIFITEFDYHLSSLREHQLTLSQGLSTRSLISFDPSSMKSVVAVLHDALVQPDLTACDIMWIAGGLATIRCIKAGHSSEVVPNPERYALFLSHRGQDAKRILAEKVMALSGQHGLFLDCLTLPRGLINRKFVFDSLGRSERILLVQTPNYRKSEWCRKEQWLAEAMGRLGLAKVERLSLDAAIKIVGDASGRARPPQPIEDLHYPIAPRILRDIEYWARHPNKHSLQEKCVSTEFLETIEEFLRASSSDPTTIAATAQQVSQLFRALASAAPNPRPIDSWSTALQYAVAAFGVGSCARSKVDVRRGIDQMNAALENIAADGIADDSVFRENLTAYLAFVSAAVTLDLAHFGLARQMEAEIRDAVGNVALLRDGILLVDVRSPGAQRDLHLKLLLALVTNNISSVGIIQTASDCVHEREIDGISLAILPCVTLHPGMDGMFPELSALSLNIHGSEGSATSEPDGKVTKKSLWRRLFGS